MESVLITEEIFKVSDNKEMDEHSLFPFTLIRGGQKELIEDIREVVESGGVLIAHAPTGIGKTVAALVPTLEYALKNKKVIFFLTPKQSQHKIAVDTLKLIKKVRKVDFTVVDVISKQAMCPRDIAQEYYAVFNELCKIEQKTRKCRFFRKYDRGVTDRIKAEIMHVEELKDLCTINGICPHRAALDAARHTNVLICDYNYLFSGISETVLDNLNIDLSDIILVVDEAHNLPNRIRNHLSDELTLNSLNEAAREMHSINELLYRHLKGVEKFFNEFMKDKNAEQNVDKESIVEGVERVLQETLGAMTYSEFVEELKVLGTTVQDEKERNKDRSSILRVAEFLDGWRTDLACSRVFSNEPTPRLYFRLLDPSVLSKDIIAGVHATIMMSGTLYPTGMYADILGAKPGKTLQKSYKSPFPMENRRIIVTKDVTTRYAERNEDMYMKIAGKITGISDAVNGNIAVFFPSYALLESIAEYIPKEKTLIERRHMSKRQKNKLYNRLTGVGEGSILLGVQAGSLSEGIDYKDNILKAVVIVGLPLSPPTLEVKNLQKYYVDKFGRDKGELYSYIYPAISKVLQAGGRGIRSETDVGVIILMDYRFTYPLYKKCLPPDYNLEVTDEPEELCRKFFKEITPVPGKSERDDQEYRYREAEEEKPAHEEELPLPLKILELIGDLDGKLGRNKIAGIIRGSKSRYINQNSYDKHECYGLLSDFTNNDVIEVIDELLERRYITSGGDPLYPTISLTEKGDDAITREEDIKLETILKRKEKNPVKTQDTLGETLTLFKGGHSPKEIAEIRGLETSTISTHLIKLMRENRIELNINDLVKPDAQEQIKEAIITVGSRRLGEVKDSLPTDMSYDEIKFVCASLIDKQKPDVDVEPETYVKEAGDISIPLRVLELAEYMDGKLGRNKLAEILTGSRAKYIYEHQYDKHRYYNSLGNFTKKKVMEIIEDLLTRGYLIKGGNRVYPVIHLTEKGCAAINEGIVDN
ncbi:MAG: helicase C-terminal domain-containing protein [Candidatus Altiarchaeota archaeon]|nr:helicase C-terminal domain-containing protein [Candidatus Altiarchaeota archaeon]